MLLCKIILNGWLESVRCAAENVPRTIVLHSAYKGEEIGLNENHRSLYQKPDLKMI